MARRVWAWLALAGLGVAGQAGEAGAQAARREISRSQYAAAERMLPANADKLVFRDKIVPQWIDGGNRFWYRVRPRRGRVHPGRSGSPEPPSGV